MTVDLDAVADEIVQAVVASANHGEATDGVAAILGRVVPDASPTPVVDGRCAACRAADEWPPAARETEEGSDDA